MTALCHLQMGWSTRYYCPNVLPNWALHASQRMTLVLLYRLPTGVRIVCPFEDLDPSLPDISLVPVQPTEVQNGKGDAHQQLESLALHYYFDRNMDFFQSQFDSSCQFRHLHESSMPERD